MKVKQTITHLPRTLFYNKQTSLALAMAVGLTAAINTFASAVPSTINVMGTGKYEVKVTCHTDNNLPVAVEERSAGDSEKGRLFKVVSNRPVSCEIVSGTLMRPVSFQPGEQPAVDFSK